MFSQRKVFTAKKRPTISQTKRIIAVRPLSQLWATSCVAKVSGKKTLRIPWVNHLSGKIAATCCIQPGSWVNTKKTPLKNCKTITTFGTIRTTTTGTAKKVYKTILLISSEDIERGNKISNINVICHHAPATETLKTNVYTPTQS